MTAVIDLMKWDAATGPVIRSNSHANRGSVYPEIGNVTGKQTAPMRQTRIRVNAVSNRYKKGYLGCSFSGGPASLFLPSPQSTVLQSNALPLRSMTHEHEPQPIQTVVSSLPMCLFLPYFIATYSGKTMQFGGVRV